MSDQRSGRYRIGTGPMPPPADTVTRDQWATLCCIATTVGLCPNEAVDPHAPVKVCAIHTSIIITQALRRFEKLIGAEETNTGIMSDEQGGT